MKEEDKVKKDNGLRVIIIRAMNNIRKTKVSFYTIYDFKKN